MASYTPMIQQYLKIKADYQDAFLFFRLGDFYEMFFDDAVNASKVLEIALTSRDGGDQQRIPMCGVPHHAASGYIEQLITKGYKVAVCEQVEDPKQAKGVVKREVVQLITPGTVMEGKGVIEKDNNFLSSISMFDDNSFGLSHIDLTTGESKVTIISQQFNDVINEIYSINAKEVVVDSQFPEELKIKLLERCQLTFSFEDNIILDNEFLNIVNKLHDDKLTHTVSRLINYLKKTQKRSLEHLQEVQVYETNQFMKIDYFSKRNLELTETIRGKGKKGSLLWLLDDTMTAMGGRRLKQWLDKPLINKEAIDDRLNMVETFINSYFERIELRDMLKEIYDLERLAGRVAFGNVNARDLVQLKKSLQQIPAIKQLLTTLDHAYCGELAEKIDPCEQVTALLEASLRENPPLTIKEGDIIADGYDPTLDKLRDASKNGKSWLAALEKQERELTGIKSLKVGYNRVFGYYIEVTKANLHLLAEGRYERKQTLTNAERFITPELKEKEALILEAEEKIVEVEYELFLHIREQVKNNISRIQQLAQIISELDVLQCFATVSEERHYCKPAFSHNGEVFLKDGRHPVVEKVLELQQYVPNDCVMNDDREILLITGPNMSGKSTYMRQIALTSILAQIGCYVPAQEAVLPIFDQVFTRIGAADDLISGQSTFMVEMLEANNAIMNASKDSLILFDEIGRGTSTYDGMALAQAIIEYIHNNIGAKMLFSTHYHELTVLENDLAKLQNIHVSAIEEHGKVVFLHKIKEGAADRSYGIHVAQLADLPDALIDRAKSVLAILEKASESEPNTKVDHAVPKEQLSLFVQEETTNKIEEKLSTKEKRMLKDIKSLDLLDMTPMDAINKLYEIQKKLK
ncbi:DNA mismatch repair protein MutS [Bacillus sp. SM2101]|uniref:DNA mismatch repair protein MutS n=1 Tax=Bacillus sp. SM2101 TaxID=2805366 RepID=UPI001BDF14E5|nr:DNA mismatch repair protein MutS [Bacillus sp. SM2101]